MCSGQSFILFIYVIAVNLFGFLLRYMAFEDYFLCFACKEMDLCKQDYDYIVVGSGSAGSIIARRLTDDKNTKVLLIEAGSNKNLLLDIPAVDLLLQNTIFDWQYRTVPQKTACLGLENKVSVWPMGKIVGGTSMLNNMIYVRGHPEDFASWYRNKPDYDYKLDILPYFKKVEASLKIADLPYRSNLSDHIMEAGKCLDYSLSDGVNAQPGFSFPKVTGFKGGRWTSAHRLLDTKRPNLVMHTNTVVEKVLMKDKYEAFAVKYSHLDEHFYAKASKGVILAAGVVGTPKILMLSGIGPKKHLKKVRITPKIDLPVGDNLQDHVTTGLDLISLDSAPTLGIGYFLSLRSAYQYFVKGLGPWTSTGCDNLAFFTTKSEVPDLQFMVMPIGVTSDNGTYLRSLIGIGDKLWGKYFAKVRQPTMTILPVVLHPKSRGTVRLKSRNPKRSPLIDPKYLSDESDVEVLLRGIELIKELVGTEPMRRLGAQLNNNTFPGCEKFGFDTKKYWRCYIKHFTLTSYHPVGTCKLGEVVDYDFRVKGTNKLYVADGSVLPELPSGNINGAVMMMAEKAADSIRNQRFLDEQRCCAKEIFLRRFYC